MICASRSCIQKMAEAEPRPLSKQEVVSKLDSIPTFNIVTVADSRIMSTTDETGAECVRWWVDVDEAQSALVVARTLPACSE